MLYGLGLMMFLFSMIFVEGSIAVTAGMAVAGVVLMLIGRRPDDDEETGF